MAAIGDSESNINLLFFPRWSKSWQSEPINNANRFDTADKISCV